MTLVGQRHNLNDTNHCFQCWYSLMFEKALPELVCICTYICVCVCVCMSFSLSPDILRVTGGFLSDE